MPTWKALLVEELVKMVLLRVSGGRSGGGIVEYYRAAPDGEGKDSDVKETIEKIDSMGSRSAGRHRAYVFSEGAGIGRKACRDVISARRRDTSSNIPTARTCAARRAS